eukprot:CAMPEP_0114582120 /NCGR_PEP_ID=MMETSP0125-20121206/6154_1 /TAXON_ID=485358 ORGANISM="Aristerostoma sp., Strain ATCC 50986" /NCGR_SAMPLE_ID=MMETSP0125 /ASSEMBLY_ACC=CAM_ASM_000245 /LENGTH=55 /DNA_ID=CAMNT_0001774861 /DNA_START=451 /DNA_END=615 /DNA_ORIENTATION=-
MTTQKDIVTSTATFFVDALTDITLEIDNIEESVACPTKFTTTMNHPTYILNKKQW